jgi:gamma-D-glutamyl-L-lysine dipeptidyl-peptidase
MKTGICNLPLIPLRSEPSERSEMISQILFGELFEVIEENDSWSHIRLLSDEYIGWCTKKMLQILPESVFKTLKKSVPTLTNGLLSPCLRQIDNKPQLYLPTGSRLYFFDKTTGSFLVYRKKTIGMVETEKEYWRIVPSSIDSSLKYSNKKTADQIVQTALHFMNAPYLWGGKSILGIDCSGLIQVVFSIFGQFLPRDARDQALLGNLVPDLLQSRAGDLAFFINESNSIVHVGLLLDANRIIHSSGCVHVDRIDSSGIYNDSLGRYTHRLHLIKRFFF